MPRACSPPFALQAPWGEESRGERASSESWLAYFCSLAFQLVGRLCCTVVCAECARARVHV